MERTIKLNLEEIKKYLRGGLRASGQLGSDENPDVEFLLTMKSPDYYEKEAPTPHLIGAEIKWEIK